MAKKQAPITEERTSDRKFVDINAMSEPNTVLWSPKAESLLIGTSAGTIHLLSGEGSQKWQVQAHSKILNASWNNDATLISTSGPDGVCKIWCAREGKLLTELGLETGWAQHLSWSPLLPLLLSASNRKVRLLSDKGSIVDELDTHLCPVTNLRWHPTLRDTFASCAADGIKIWKLSAHHPTYSLNCSEHPEHLAFSRTGTMLAYGSNDGSVNVWNMGSGIVLKAKTGIRTLSGIDWSWGGQWLSFSGEHEAYLWGFRGNGPRAAKPEKLFGSFGRLKQLQFHPYEHLLATADNEGSVHVWRTDRDDRLMPIAMCHYDFPATAINWNPLYRRLAIGYSNGVTRIWSNDFTTPNTRLPGGN